VEEILHQAEQLEKEYDWLGATALHEKTLNLLSDSDFSRKGDAYERLGYAFYRAAFQAESSDEFRERMRQAILSDEKAKEFFVKMAGPGKTPRMLRCDAMIAFIRFWLASEAHERKNLIDQCWKLAGETLSALEEGGNGLEYGRTFNEFSKSADFSFNLEWDWQIREKIIKEAVKCGEQAIQSLSTVQDNSELARAYAKTADYLCAFGYLFLNQDEREMNFAKARDYWRKANDLSESAAVLESLSTLEGLSLEFSEGTEGALRHYEKALEYGRKVNDRFIVGRSLDMLTYHMGWSMGMIDDPDETVTRRKKVLQYATEARNQYSKINFTSPGNGYLWVEAPDSEYYLKLARSETDLGKRRELLKKAEEAAPYLLERAENSAYPDAALYAHHVFSLLLAQSADMEANPESKKNLLEKALQHRNDSSKIIEQIAPSMYWERGGMKMGLAHIKSLLAESVVDSETKTKMVLEAIADSESAIQLCTKGITSEKGPTGLLSSLAFVQYSCGLLLNRVYKLTHNRDHLVKAEEAFEKAADIFRKLDQMSNVAQCHWKTAKTYDVLGDHLRAAENFELASNDYKSAAEKTRELKEFYLDHAVYMQAWSEIEKARHHHERQEYGPAHEHFDKAASLHKPLKKWSYLTPNYCAWAQVETAEDLSRKDQSEEATKAFEKATDLFKETKESLEAQLNKIEDPDEKQMATNILKATDVRHDYCIARIAVEQGKTLDKKGDHYSSSQRYESAADAFEKISQALESEQEQKEIRFIITLTRAWQMMTLAEAESSPNLYAEASELFERAKDSGQSEKTKTLVLGHSRFCKALEAGTRFADTRDPAMHALAVQHLASASNYYIRADFQNASEYAKATRLLFDAYRDMDNAEKETDPDKKARLYTMAEKVLQTSAGSYTKAEHPEKREQVLRLLEKVKEERELVTSLTEALHAPSIISATTTFNAPAQTHEEAVGSERFERADIQANITARQKELRVGENLHLELELVNAGRTPALLIKVTEIIPKDFELAEESRNIRIEDDCINMRGKRLDSMKTEQVTLVLKPKVQGTFQLKPRILYLDENGGYRSHEPEPISITVKELGIKGWLKGER